MGPRAYRRRRRRGAGLALAALAVGVPAAAPASAWTPKTQAVIAAEAARLAPPDLYRQIDRHRRSLREGAMAPFADGEPARHAGNPDGTGRLARVIAEEMRRAIATIEAPRPFDDIVYQLGVVAHFVADASNPLAAAESDPQEARYFADFSRYLESAEPRLPVVFYGVPGALDGRHDPDRFAAGLLVRSRGLYPLVGREYRRIDFASGAARFDDRSTAFGVASLAFSHAVSDVGAVFRAIWLAAGGADLRRNLPREGEAPLRLPRAR